MKNTVMFQTPGTVLWSEADQNNLISYYYYIKCCSMKCSRKINFFFSAREEQIVRKSSRGGIPLELDPEGCIETHDMNEKGQDTP